MTDVVVGRARDAGNLESQSDIVLACVLLAVSAVVIWDSGLPFLQSYETEPGFFPSAIAGLMLVVAAVLLARGTLTERVPRRCNGLLTVAVSLALAAAIYAAFRWFPEYLLRFGPPEFASVTVCLFAISIALSCRSRIRAFATTLIGLMLATVGMDVVTGQLRLTFGFEELFDGFDILIVAPGLIVVADALICLYSPSLLFESYGWLVKRWRVVDLSPVVEWILRAVAFVAITQCLSFAYAVNNRGWDVAIMIILGLFGIVCKYFDWNRLTIVLAVWLGTRLEESLRQSLLLADGDMMRALARPLTATFLAIGLIALVAAAFLSLRRMPAGDGQ